MAQLNIVEKVIALEAVDLLKNLSPEQLSRIASISKRDESRTGQDDPQP
jgi:hypothetical protein